LIQIYRSDSRYLGRSATIGPGSVGIFGISPGGNLERNFAGRVSRFIPNCFSFRFRASINWKFDNVRDRPLTEVQKICAMISRDLSWFEHFLGHHQIAQRVPNEISGISRSI
jgi:hypothetical protein